MNGVFVCVCGGGNSKSGFLGQTGARVLPTHLHWEREGGGEKMGLRLMTTG